MDKGTVIGLGVGLTAIFGAAVVEAGSPTILVSLLNVPSALIVFGGTLGATLIAFPLERVLTLNKTIGVALRAPNDEAQGLIQIFVGLAEKARREGLLALEQEAEKITDEFLKKGLLQAVDGTDPGLVREIMEAEVAATSARHEGRYAMLAAMGGFAPTMGIIGTVMGLVNVLSHLDNPNDLGKSISTAFIATLYGVMSANVLWLPLGERLKQRNKEEVELRELVIEGVLAVQAGDNPRVVRDKLEALIAPARRARPDEAGSGALAGAPAGVASAQPAAA